MNVLNQFSLLRKESFGGTLSNAVSGKRIYVNAHEFQQIKDSGCLTCGLQAELKTNSSEVIICEPEILPTDNFSAPDIVFLELTRRCNLRCTHCLNDSGKPLSTELTHEQRNALLDDFCASGVQEVRFTGGEPLLITHLFDYIAKIRINGLRASLGTNGTLIDATVARNLFEVGLNLAVVSVDGLEMQHNRIRGPATFQKTIGGIELLRQFHIPVRVNMVATKSNLSDVPSVAQYFYDRNVPIMIRRLIPSGRATDTREMLSTEDYDSLRERLRKLLSAPSRLVSGHYLREEEIIPRIKLPFAWHKCKAGRRGLSIMPDGRVYTCGFLEPLGIPSVGNIGNDNLAKIWKRLRVSATSCTASALSEQSRLVRIQDQKAKT